MNESMRRREFIALAAATPLMSACQQGGSATAPTPVAQTPAEVPPLPPPAGGSPAPPSTAPSIMLSELPARVENGELVVAIAGTSLQTVGGVARTDGFVSGLHRYILLARTAADRISAINGICTHEGCIINRVAAPAFECPCHGSQYDQSGVVLRGPAPAALPQLTTMFDGVTVRIRV